MSRPWGHYQTCLPLPSLTGAFMTLPTTQDPMLATQDPTHGPTSWPRGRCSVLWAGAAPVPPAVLILAGWWDKPWLPGPEAPHMGRFWWIWPQAATAYTAPWHVCVPRHLGKDTTEDLWGTHTSSHCFCFVWYMVGVKKGIAWRFYDNQKKRMKNSNRKKFCSLGYYWGKPYPLSSFPSTTYGVPLLLTSHLHLVYGSESNSSGCH